MVPGCNNAVNDCSIQWVQRHILKRRDPETLESNENCSFVAKVYESNYKTNMDSLPGDLNTDIAQKWREKKRNVPEIHK